MNNVKRLDDPSVPVATTTSGLIIYGMQGGQTVKVLTSLLGGTDGIDGVNGASAYQVAVQNGFVGTVSEWLLSLVGKSAYEVWLENNTGTKEDFFRDIIEPVSLVVEQSFTDEQKKTARDNIGAMSRDDVEFEEYSETEYEDL